MNKNDLIKKLENIDLPEANLPSHQRRLKMALLNSGYWKEKTSMSLLKKLAPIGAVAVIALLVVVGVNYFKSSSSVNNLSLTPAAYAKELVKKSAETLAGSNAVPLPTAATCTIEDMPKGVAGTAEIKNGKCIIHWARPDDNGVVRDEKDNIVFIITPEGELVPAPKEKPSLESSYVPQEVIFDDINKAKNTAGYYITAKPPLGQTQIETLRNSGVRLLYKSDPENANVHFALIEEDKVEDVKKLDFIVSVTLPPTKGTKQMTDSNDKGIGYTFTKDSFKSFLEEAKKAPDLTYLGDKRVGDPSKPLSAVGRKIKILQFTDEKGNTTILGIDENNYPVVRLAYTQDGGASGVMFGSGELKGITPPAFNLEEQIKYWTENLEQPIDFNAIQK